MLGSLCAANHSAPAPPVPTAKLPKWILGRDLGRTPILMQISLVGAALEIKSAATDESQKGTNSGEVSKRSAQPWRGSPNNAADTTPG